MAELIYGFHPVREGLRGRRTPLELFVDEKLKKDKFDELETLAVNRHVPIRRRRREDLNRLVGNVHNQGVVLSLEPFHYTDFDDVLASCRQSGQDALFIVLDGITDPHNLGAILRNADAAGCTAVILPKDRNCRINSVVDRASAGAVEHLRICQVTNLVRTLKQLQDFGAWVYGLASNQEGQNLYNADLKGHVALVVGNEGSGLRLRTRQQCDLLMSIPMAGEVASLNASCATAIALFEIIRQRFAK
ncbi:MAG: 23S rRNA (guanosine(2251)-2'-O)-methyltransferase RlmB [Deltaproteobacteria bacterium]|jgi:23S rRNA (guanosine2251-2'-O)-methyltransferase|nr:23S rRNA (guanosine(2251)-2'-O)-methyltransferase RlmB [Deltaproteobacteria bacterium]